MSRHHDRPLSSFRLASGLLLALAAGAVLLAQQSMSIPSVTPTSLGPLLRHNAPAVTVTGELYMPAHPSGAVPVMVLKHGSGGLRGPTGDNIRAWAKSLAGWGVAALVVDSFGPRGLSETASDQAQLSSWADVADALSALKVLGADPRFDRTRIGVMGWSRGGGVAFNTALETVRKTIVSDDLKFAAHVVFYGNAEIQYRDTATDQSPMLFFHGEADDYVPAGPTREFADWIKSMGNPVTFITYPRAYHDFDVLGGSSGLNRNVETAKRCDVVMNVTNGRVTRMDHKDSTATTDEMRAYVKGCTTKGATLAPNSAARADAVEKVHAFLKDVFHLS